MINGGKDNGEWSMVNSEWRHQTALKWMMSFIIALR